MITGRTRTKETLNFLGACFDSPEMRKLIQHQFLLHLESKGGVHLPSEDTRVRKTMRMLWKNCKIIYWSMKMGIQMPNMKCIHKNAIRFPVLETKQIFP